MIILWLLKLGITMLIHNKDDIEFVTEFPCFLGHPVSRYRNTIRIDLTQQGGLTILKNINIFRRKQNKR